MVRRSTTTTCTEPQSGKILDPGRHGVFRRPSHGWGCASRSRGHVGTAGARPVARYRVRTDRDRQPSLPSRPTTSRSGVGRRDPYESTVRVRAASLALLDAGVTLHALAADKEWSLTDRISFHVMRQRNLTRALAHDKHFVQA